VEAAVHFVRDGGRAVIADLDQAREALGGDAGTEIVSPAT
jgi:carbamate kinase